MSAVKAELRLPLFSGRFGNGRGAAAAVEPQQQQQQQQQQQESSAASTNSNRPPSESLSAVEAALAGALARVVAQFMLHPLDVVRTRRQVKSLPSGQVYNFRALRHGLGPQLLLAGPAGAVQFTTVDMVRRKLTSKFDSDEAQSSKATRICIQLFSAAAGATMAAAIRVPQEVLKQVVMAELYPNAIAAASSIFATQGVRGLYKGLSATVTRDVLWNSLSFAIFKFLDERANDHRRNDNVGEEKQEDTAASSYYWRGIAAGTLAAVVTHPLDVLKTRVMTSKGGHIPSLASLIATEGPFVLTRGLLPRLLYLGPLASLVLATNEVVAAMLIARKDRQQHDLHLNPGRVVAPI